MYLEEEAKIVDAGGHISRADSLTDDLLDGTYKRPFLTLRCFATDLACNFAIRI